MATEEVTANKGALVYIKGESNIHYNKATSLRPLETCESTQ